MSDILCSKVYQDFFNKLPEEGVSMNMLMQHISRTIPPVAKALSIARLEISLQAPRTPYEVNGRDDHQIIYTENDYYNSPFSVEYITGEKGVVRLFAYPQQADSWTVEDEEQVSFLLKNLYFISGRARIMEIMSRMTITDTLTGLPNTPGLARYCNTLHAHGQLSNYHGLFLNLKNFKYINRRVGSDVGNEVLRKYAHTIHSALHPQEMFARMGGDTFFALILNDNVQSFVHLIEHVPIEVTYNDTLITFDLTAKVGVYPVKSSDTVNNMMDGSSLAMAAAKASVAHDFMWFHPSILEKAVHRKEITSLFPIAINAREFVIYYQPKVSLADNTLHGSEALVRWIRDGKLVPPMEFIPILEQEGLICTLDFYVLDSVCRDIRSWLDAGIEPVRTSVNFSKLHLHNRNLAQDIIAVLNKYQLDSKYIEIELTETTGYEDLDNLNQFVNAMKAQGIQTSLDDFGTGYSSLNLLKDLNVDIIKLDRSFLRNIENNETSDDVIVKTIVKMITDLNMQVVAEGVETSAQADYLRSIQCPFAQGYLFDKPLPHDDFEKCLTGEKTYDSSL